MLNVPAFKHTPARAHHNISYIVIIMCLSNVDNNSIRDVLAVIYCRAIVFFLLQFKTVFTANCKLKAASKSNKSVKLSFHITIQVTEVHVFITVVLLTGEL